MTVDGSKALNKICLFDEIATAVEVGLRSDFVLRSFLVWRIFSDTSLWTRIGYTCSYLN